MVWVMAWYAADGVGRMIGFLIRDLFVWLGRCLFQWMVRVLVGRGCALLFDLFFYSYEIEFFDSVVRSDCRRFARPLDLCY